MKLHHRVLALALAAAMALGLTACNPSQALEDMLVNAIHAMGLGNADAGDETEKTYAEQGGSITFPEGFDPASSFHTLLQEGQLFIGFNDLSLNKLGNTDYFTAAGDSMTITAYGSTDTSKTSIDSYKIALWELSDDGHSATYVVGSTIYIPFSSDETCYTHTVTGLTPGKHYKASVTFDSTVAYAAGGICISGLTDDALMQADGSQAEDGAENA